MSRASAPETNAPPSSESGILPPHASEGPWSVEQVVGGIPAHSRPPTVSPSSPVPYFHLLQRLKTTKREGWRRFGIQHGESISDHMYRMAMITMLAPPSLAQRLDLNKCTRMALIHDVAESLVGDITPVDNVSKSEKNRRESTSMDYICSTLLGRVDGGTQGDEIRRIWQEYEDSESAESLFVHDVDKIELILQMVEYEKTYAHGISQEPASASSASAAAAVASRGTSMNGEAAENRLFDLGEFTWVAQKIKMPEVKEWARDLLTERNDFWAARGVTSVRGYSMQV